MQKGDIVIGKDEYWGTYGGEVMSMNIGIQIKIMFCLSYPRQWAIFNKDVPVERSPYSYQSIHGFSRGNVSYFAGNVLDYQKSVSAALEMAMVCEDNNILKQHRSQLIA